MSLLVALCWPLLAILSWGAQLGAYLRNALRRPYTASGEVC